MSHTPGPWTVSQKMTAANRGRVFTPDENEVFTECDGDLLLADAHLIAAAPDMLEALHVAHSFLRHLPDSVLMTSGKSTQALVDAAIAKAEGHARRQTTS